MLDVLMWSFWGICITYCIWFFFMAKTHQPLTLDDLALSWRLHKSQTQCLSSGIHNLISKKGAPVGFKCDCGHEFIQMRLINQKGFTRSFSHGEIQHIPLNVPLGKK